MKTPVTPQNRREFVKSLPLGALLCLTGADILAASPIPRDNGDAGGRHKFQADAGMTYEQVCGFAFRNWYIRYLKGMESELGKENLLELLKTVGANLYAESAGRMFRKVENRTVDTFITNFWGGMKENRFWSNVITIDIERQTQQSGVVKMTECLVAKTFREAEAADIGYAAICHADYAVASAFNPKMRLTRNQCLMNGDPCCYFEYQLS